jgi:hypothetical protein
MILFYKLVDLFFTHYTFLQSRISCEGCVSVHNFEVVNYFMRKCVILLKVRAYQCVKEYIFLREAHALDVALFPARLCAKPVFC